jgi:uncharacterized protein YutE (UPF0331/DUF86 family)
VVEDGLRKTERRRLARRIGERLYEFPRQLAALKSAMSAFGEEFEIARFKSAFDSSDPAVYNSVQALERAVGRVQNILTDLAVDGARLAELPVGVPKKGESRAKPSFDALRDAGVIEAGVCRRLESGQKARSRLEHDYFNLSAGEVHRATKTVRQTAPEFIVSYRPWIEPYLD